MTTKRAVGWIIAFALTDTFCVGVGMGVPLLCIIFGLLVGIQAMHINGIETSQTLALRRLLWISAATSGFTMLAMVAIWGPCVQMLADEDAALANFGVPMLLFAPRPSFIAWLVLMILISPFLQFLMTLLGGCLRLAWKSA